MIRVFALLFMAVLCGCTSLGEAPPNTTVPQYAPPANAIILRVKVVEVEFTDFYPGVCESEADCVPFHFWYRYHAQVKEVIAGHWPSEQVRFTHLQHAEYISALIRDCYVVLVPATPELQEKIGVPLVADQILFTANRGDSQSIRRIRQATK